MVSSFVFRVMSALLTLEYLVIPTEQYQCLDKCQCVWVSGKLTADCQGLALNHVPNTPTTDGNAGKRESAEEIQVINLTRNNLSQLKNGVFSDANLVNLQRISLSRVGLETIDTNAFHRLANLIELDVSGNALKHIPSESFASLLMLSKLDLSANQINSVLKHAFFNLSKLKALSLQQNRINFIDSQAFVGLKSLETLKLSDNNLANIDSTCLVPLEKLHSLTLSDNPWQCDCKMRSLRKYFMVHNLINIPDEPMCAQTSVTDIKNAKSRKMWTNLSLKDFVCPPVMPLTINEKNNSYVELNATEGSSLVLECALPIEGDDTSHSPSINWYWNNRQIHNNSKTCSSFVCQSADALQQQQSNNNSSANNQYFVITNSIEYERANNKYKNKMQAKLEISRLMISSVLVFNSGPYYCDASNSAGNAQKNFAVNVLPANVINSSSASAESHSINYNSIMTSGIYTSVDNQTDRVLIGVVIGIFFGIFLVLALCAISLFVLCRRRVDRRVHNRQTVQINKINGNSTRNTNSSEHDDTELEKLTPNSMMNATIYNPIQKPPRLLERANNECNAKTPEVWLIKRNNGCTPLMENYGDDDYGYGSHTPVDNEEHNVYVEPDLIHQSAAYVRINKQQLVSDLDDEHDISYELRWN